jgi:acyl transferase domain-containing protein/aryl carrier-like protein
MQVGLAALWRAWGIEPAAVVGHSMGEVAAAHVAGALTLEDAAAVICRRSRLLRRISGQGEMAVVELTLAEAEAALAGYEARLSVAVSNSPRSTVLSGDPAALAAVLAALEARGVFCRRVKVDVASHSPQVDVLREELLAALAGIRPARARVPMRSTVTGALVDGTELGASYWADNVRQPVRFAAAVQALLADGHALFVEVSPHPLLVPAVEEMLRAARPADAAGVGAAGVGAAGMAIASLRRAHDERAAMLESLGALWARGQSVAWSQLFPGGGRRVPLPTYAWQRERHWLETEVSQARVHTGGHPLLGQGMTLSTQPGTRVWETPVSVRRVPWLGDHRIQGVTVVPGTAYLEMALAAAADDGGRAGPHEITEVVLSQALAFADNATATVQLVTTEEPAGRRFQIASLAPGAARASWRVHCQGALRRTEHAAAPTPLDLDAIRARFGPSEPAPAFYAEHRTIGFDFGPSFQGLVELWRGDGEALGRVQLPEAAGSIAAYRMHPALLDACLQAMGGLTRRNSLTTPWVPVEVGSLRLWQPPAGELWCHARERREGPPPGDRRSCDLQIVDGTGAVVVEISGLVVQRLEARALQREEHEEHEEDEWLLALDWEPAAVGAPAPPTGRWLLLGGGELGAALRGALEAAGHAAVHAPVGELGADPDPARALLAEAFGGQAPTAVVHLGSLEVSGELDAGTVEAALTRGPDSALVTVQALAAMSYREAPRLWLLTRGAQAVAQDAVAVAQAPLLGLGRVIALEHPELRCVRVDLDPARPEGEPHALLAELLANGAEDEIAWRAGQRFVGRLARGAPDARPRASGSAGPGHAAEGAIRRDGSYLVTGGLGGLGLSVAGWLADQGAGHLVLLGRSGAASPEQQAAVAALSARGARVTVARADVADRGQLERVLHEVDATGMPLRGIVHTAGILDDGLLLQQTPARLRPIMASKALGALHLHELTRAMPLSFFVMYSSSAGLLGTPGQGNYAAANTFLDALAQHRKALGLPALSIAWGAFSEVGLAARPDLAERRDGSGMRSIRPEQGLSVLARLLAGDRAQIGVVSFDAQQWAAAICPTAGVTQRFSRLLAAPPEAPGRSNGGSALLARLAAAAPDERIVLVEQALRSQVSQVLRLAESKLDVHAPLTSLGMDSLMGLTLKHRLKRELAVEVPLIRLLSDTTVVELTRFLDAQMTDPTALPQKDPPGAGWVDVEL